MYYYYEGGRVCLVLNKIAEGVFFIGSTFKKKKKKKKNLKTSKKFIFSNCKQMNAFLKMHNFTKRFSLDAVKKLRHVL
jgi:hypothetical protein